MKKLDIKSLVIGFIIGTFGVTSVFGVSTIKSAILSNTKVTFNGVSVPLTNSLISIVKDEQKDATLYMPTRELLEYLGYTVNWNDKLNSIDLLSNNSKIDILQAKEIIFATDNFSGRENTDVELLEITPSDFWDKMNCQIFKIINGSNYETFVIKNKKAIVIGFGFGGSGVTSAVPFDVNKDGILDIVYAYSWGSGMHRSLISWLDMNNYTNYPVNSLIDEPYVRTDDLILKVEQNQIIVYRIVKEMQTSSTELINIYNSLSKYPSSEDIDKMTLQKDSVLFWKNNVFSEKPK